MEKGKIIVISGPSGVGKHTIFENLLKSSLNLHWSISMTTRKKRDGEIDGKDYFFVSDEEFNKAINNNELIEWVEYCGNKYGTPKESLLNSINEGKNVLLEIEVIGANNIFNLIDSSDILSIFILPPSIDVLFNRLKQRGTENDESINSRLKTAKYELTFQDKYQFNVINDNLENCIKEVINIIENNTNIKINR